jgi:hypothetical protein
MEFLIQGMYDQDGDFMSGNSLACVSFRGDCASSRTQLHAQIAKWHAAGERY